MQLKILLPYNIREGWAQFSVLMFVIESGLNDGTGFPFVLLCIRFITRHEDHDSVGTIIAEWVVHDIVWEVFLGVIVGIVAGYIVGMN